MRAREESTTRSLRSQPLDHLRSRFEALSQAALRVQNVLEPDQVLAEVGAQLKAIGLDSCFALITGSGDDVVIMYISLSPDILDRLRKTLGRDLHGLRFSVEQVDALRKAIRQRQARFTDGAPDTEELVPGLTIRMIREALDLQDQQGFIVAPLLVGGEVLGVLFVWGTTLGPDDLPAMVTFAQQAALSYENARRYQAERRTRARSEETQAEIEALLEATKQIRSSLDLSETLNAVLDNVLRLSHADFAGVMLLDESDQHLRYAVARGPRAEELASLSVPFGQGVSGTVAKTGQIINVREFADDPRPYFQKYVHHVGIRSGVYAPLWKADKPIGVLVAMSLQSDHFSPSRERILADLAEQTSLAITHAREIAERERNEVQLEVRARQQAVVAELGQDALAGMSISDLMNRIVQIAKHALDVDFCELLELLSDGDDFLVRAGIGWTERNVGQITVPADRNTQAGYTLLSQQPVIVEDFQQENRVIYPDRFRRHAIVSGLTVIIPAKYRPFGVLGVYSIQKREFTRDDVHFLQAVSNVLALALERERSERQRSELLELERAAREEAEASSQEIAALYEATKQITASLDLSTTLNQILDNIVRLAATDIAGLVFVGRSSQWLAYEAVRGPLAHRVQGERFKIGEGVLGFAATANDVIEVPDVRLEPRWQNRPPEIRSGIWIPLRSGERTFGILVGMSRLPHYFDPSRRRLLIGLAEQAALAIEHAREVTERKRAEDTQRFLADASAFLASSLDISVTLDGLARLSVPFLGDWCIIDLIGEDEIVRHVAVAAADPSKDAIALKLQRYQLRSGSSKGGMSQVLKTSKSVLYPTVTADVLRAAIRDQASLEIALEMECSSVMIVPLLARGRTFGAMTFVAGASRPAFNKAKLAIAEELGHRAGLAIDNIRLYRQATEAVNKRDEFLSVAAHELKTPVTSLRGYAQLTARQFEKYGMVDPERLKRSIDAIDQQSKKLTNLIAQLLDVSRLEAGKLTLERRPTDVVLLVEQIVAAAREQTDHHEMVLESPDSITAVVDPMRLEQVITNLIDNATKFSPDGGTIRIEIATTTPDQFEIRVTDQGIGIPHEHRSHLFERYYQAHSQRHSSGMGLGLYISRQIVEMHGGQIDVEFPEERGTSFRVELPIGADASSGAKQGPE